MSTFERPKTAQEAVLVEIRQQLLDGRLPPGAAVRPDATGAELGVSAVPVREALRILEGEGHVHYRPHRGYIVADLEIDDLTEIYRIRELLEAEAIRRAVPRLEASDLDTLREIVREMEQAEDDVVRLTAVNRRFHFTVFELAGMPLLVRFLRNLWDASDRYRARYLSDPEHRALVQHQHQRIMDALAAGHAERVNEEMHVHRQQAIASLSELGLAGSGQAGSN